MHEIKLRAAGIADITTISDLAKIIWNQHYTSIISREQINYMLDMMYSKTSLQDQMQIKGDQFFLIEKDGIQLGFISVHRENGSNWFLSKFYVNQDLASKGIGTGAFQQLLKIINPEQISLTVNRQNKKSINFYFKLGFKIEKVADFDIGNAYVMNDFVMTWKMPAKKI